jgi:hypothetical protein
LVDAAPVSLISAFTALVASIAGPFVTLYVARTQMRVTVRSANRQRWIEEFRDLIAQFCSEIAIAAQNRESMVKDGRIVIGAERDLLGHFGKLVYTANKIRLMIDPHEREHRELLASIDALLALFRAGSENGDLQAAGQDMAQRIVGLTVAIVRKEWVRVQKGA